MTGKTVEILLQGQVIAQFDESNTKKLLKKNPHNNLLVLCHRTKRTFITASLTNQSLLACRDKKSYFLRKLSITLIMLIMM